jgi:hypothetical protein
MANPTFRAPDYVELPVQHTDHKALVDPDVAAQYGHLRLSFNRRGQITVRLENGKVTDLKREVLGVKAGSPFIPIRHANWNVFDLRRKNLIALRRCSGALGQPENRQTK